MKNRINNQQQKIYEELWENEWQYLHKIGPSVRSRNRILLNQFKKHITNGSVFDTGCGDGSFLSTLHKYYQEELIYHAGDISETAMTSVKKMGFVNSTMIIDIENHTSLPQRTFTAVVSAEVLEHVENWQTALQNLAELVAENGFLFLTVPAQMKYWNPHDIFAKHYRRFEIGQIEQELLKMKFEIRLSWCWGWPFYWFYYNLILKNSKPQSVMKDINSSYKILASNILYTLFILDDLFDTTLGRRLFIVAQKHGKTLKIPPLPQT